MNKQAFTFLVTGGGTGGHVYPAIAIADALRTKQQDARIEFAGSKDRIEWTAVPKSGYRIHPIWISGLQRRLTLANMLVPLKLTISLFQSLFIMRKLRPDAVICTGGYVSGPVGWVAAKLNVPVFLQEQNSFPGVTTRLLSGYAKRVFTAFSQADKYLPKAKGRISLLGNPTRKEIVQSGTTEPHKAFGLDPKLKTLLVLGGSGGAGAINDAIEQNLAELHNNMNLQIIWQCGPRYVERIRMNVKERDFSRLRLLEFIDDMGAAYEAADVVITRAGAGICAELLIAGKPSILMPSPNVAGDHQKQNAMAMVEGNAAIILEDSEAGLKLVPTLSKLLGSSETLAEMSAAALKMAKPDAAEMIAAEIIETLENESRN